jgi:hypothetical protein
MPRASTTAKRRGEAAEAATSTVVDTVEPNPAVDAQLQAIGMPAPEPGDETPPIPLAPRTEQPTVVPKPTSEQSEEPATSTVVTPAEAPAAAEPPPLRPPAPDELVNPFTTEPAPEPRTTKTQQRNERTDNRQALNQMPPSTRRFGSQLGRKLPGSEHVIVHKRLETGQLAYAGEYHQADLSQSQNLESFLAKFVQPKYGPGEYQITAVDGTGREYDAGYILLLKPLDEPDKTPGAPVAGPNLMNLVQQMFDRESARRDQEFRVLAGTQKDPIEMMRKVHELQKDLTPPAPPLPALKPSEKGSSTTDTVLAGMMQMMSTVLVAAMQPKATDPLLVALIQKLTESNPQAVNPAAQLVQLSEVLRNLQGSNNASSQMLEMLMKERMSPADVLGLVNQVKGERGTDDLKKSMENLGFLLNAVQQLRAHTEPGASGFWEAVSSFLANPGFASALGSKVTAAVRSSQPPAPPGRPALPAPQALQPPAPAPARDPLALKARELIARKQRIEELELLKRERELGLAPPADAPALAPATEPVAKTVAAPEEVSLPATPDQQVSLPPRITDHLNNYMAAKDDADIVRTTLELIFSLAEDEQWRPYSEVIVSLIVQNDRARFMHYMASLLTALRTMKLMEDSLARKIMDTLQRHFDTIVAETQERIEAAQQEEAEPEEGEGEGEGEGEEEGQEDPEDLLKLE